MKNRLRKYLPQGTPVKFNITDELTGTGVIIGISSRMLDQVFYIVKSDQPIPGYYYEAITVQSSLVEQIAE